MIFHVNFRNHINGVKKHLRDALSTWLEGDPYETPIVSRHSVHVIHTISPPAIEHPIALADEDLADLWIDFEKRTRQQIYPQDGLDIRQVMYDLLTLEIKHNMTFNHCNLHQLIALRLAARNTLSPMDC